MALLQSRSYVSQIGVQNKSEQDAHNTGKSPWNRRPGRALLGLGEMPPAQLKATTMDPRTRTLLRVGVAAADRAATESRVESLMGRRPELRLAFIQG